MSHAKTIDQQLDRAADICQTRGVKLTELRRQVLGLVLQSERPAGAYDLLEALRQQHKGAAPPTVYRALDFLLEHGLIHKVESLSAFVGCEHDLGHPDHHDCSCAHSAQFLICRSCGRTTELNAPSLLDALRQAAAKVGFSVDTAMIEAKGLCSACSHKKEN